jgi:hypothetical protein
MEWVDSIKEALPEYAKDTRLNIDAVIKRSTLAAEEAEAVALAAAFATGNSKLWTWIQSQLSDQKEAEAARSTGRQVRCVASALVAVPRGTDTRDRCGHPLGARTARRPQTRITDNRRPLSDHHPRSAARRCIDRQTCPGPLACPTTRTSTHREEIGRASGRERV